MTTDAAVLTVPVLSARTLALEENVSMLSRQLQTLQGAGGTLEPVSAISGWQLTAGLTDPTVVGSTTFVGQGQMLLAGPGIKLTRPAHTNYLEIDIGANGFPCYDYVICKAGCGTHLTVRAMMADFITAAEAAPGITKSCWLCDDDQDMNIEFGSANGNVASATLSIEGAGVVHEANSNAATPRHKLTAGPDTSMIAGSAYFKTTNPYRPRLVYRNVILWAKATTDVPTISFHNASGGAGAVRMMVALYDCDLHIGGSGSADAASANGVICDGDTNGAGNGAELYLNNCRGNVGGLIRFHINNAAGNVEVDNCRMSMFSLGSDITVSTLGNITFRNGFITTTGYLLFVNGNGGNVIDLQGTLFRHTGATIWLRHTGGSINPNTRLYMEGLDYSQSSSTLGAATISPSASGGGHTVFIDSCSFRSDSANAATAIVVTGTNWLTSQIGNVAAPNFAATSSGIGAALPSLVIGGPGGSTPTPGSGLEIISPTTPGNGLTILLPRFPTTARPGTPTNGMLYYDSTLTRFIGYENGAWATIVTNEGEGLRYPLLVGRGSPAGNIFTGYASWGTDVGASGYSTALLAFTPGGYWRMGEAAGQPQDSSGNANHTTITGGTPTYSQTGALSGDANTAILFNGSTGYFSAPDAATIDPADTFTVMAWIKRTATQGTVQDIVSKGTNAFEFRIHSDNKLMLVKENVAAIVSSTTTITDTTGYHFVVATKSGATVKLYIDAVDVTGVVTNATCATNTALLYIGRRSTAADSFFNGTIDEVAVFPTALTAANIATLYAAGTASAPAPVNTSDGDITGQRLNIGNVAIPAGTLASIHPASGTAGLFIVTGINTLRFFADVGGNAYIDLANNATNDLFIGSARRVLLMDTNGTPVLGLLNTVGGGNATITIGGALYVSTTFTVTPVNLTPGDISSLRLFVGNFAPDSETRTTQIIDAYTPTAGAFNSLYVKSTVSPGVGLASDEQRAGKFSVKVQPTANYVGTTTGFYAESDHNAGVFNVASMQGFFAQVLQNVAATTVTTMTGARIVYRPVLGTVGTAIGLQITRGALGDASTLTTGIGLQIDATIGSVPTTDIALLSLGGQHRLIGPVNVGTNGTPQNATNGDLTAKRIIAGDDTALTGAARWMLNIASFVPAATHTSAVVTTVYAPAGLGSTAAAFEVDAHVQNTASDAGEYWGGVFTVYHDGGSTFALTGSPGLVGLEGTVVIVSGATGNITEADGIRASIRPRSTATTTWASALRAIPAGSGAGDTTGTLTNSAGLYVQNKVAGVTVGTQHGIYIEALTGASTDNIAIRTLGGTHRFVGGLNLGSDVAPAAAHVLDLHGALAIDNQTSFDFRDSGGTLRAGIYLGSDNNFNLSVAGAVALRILNQAQNAMLWQVTNAGVVTWSGPTILTPSSTQSIAVSAPIVANATVVQVSTTTAANMTATPTIADGTDGQILTIVNVGANTFTLQDQGTLASSNLRLSAAGIALGTRDSIQLMYSATIGDWIQIGQVNVI